MDADFFAQPILNAPYDYSGATGSWTRNRTAEGEDRARSPQRFVRHVDSQAVQAQGLASSGPSSATRNSCCVRSLRDVLLLRHETAPRSGVT